jgi:hypothetical protein
VLTFFYNLIKIKIFQLRLCRFSDYNTFFEGGLVISYSDTITPLITLRHILTSIWKEISVRNYICRELNNCKELK